MKSGVTNEELLSAIRKHCLSCSGGSIKGVERCLISYCDLYPYRSKEAMGIKTQPTKLKGQIGFNDLLKG